MMLDKMTQLLRKKKSEKGEVSPLERDAKMSVLKDLHGMASKAMGDKLGGLKKVSVASNTPEGLSEGLDKAKAIVGDSEHEAHDEPAEIDPEMLESDEQMDGNDPEHRSELGSFAGEEHGAEQNGIPALSDAEIEARIAHLVSLKGRHKK